MCCFSFVFPKIQKKVFVFSGKRKFVENWFYFPTFFGPSKNLKIKFKQNIEDFRNEHNKLTERTIYFKFMDFY